MTTVHERGATRISPVNLQVAICLPRDGQSVGLVRDIVGHAFQIFGVAPATIDEVRLALSEACTNVVQHAAADDDYEVRLFVDEAECSIRVINTGGEFDARSLAGVMPDPSSPRGRGVAIMQAVMDRVEFSVEPEVGTIVHLIKSLSFGPDAPLRQARA